MSKVSRAASFLRSLFSYPQRSEGKTQPSAGSSFFRSSVLRICLLLATVLGLLAAGQTAQAQQSLFFTGSGTTSTWDDNGTNFNWSSSSGGPYNSIWTDGNGATFEGSAGTVNVLNAINSVSYLTFNIDGYVLNGGTINLAGAGGLITTGSATDTINSVLTGTGGLTKLGSGMLVLNGSNTYTGNTLISAGTLQAGPNASGNILPLGTLLTLGSGASSGVFDLGGGPGNTQTLAGLYTSGTGTANQVIDSMSGAGNTGVLTLAITGADTYGGQLGGPGANNFKISLNGTGVLTLTASNTFTGGSFIYGGTASLGNLSALGTGAIALGNNIATSAAVLLNTGGLTLANNITVSSNAAQAMIGGSNTTGTTTTFSGTTTVNAGTNLVLTSGNGGTTVFNNLITSSGSITVSAPGGTVVLSATNNNYGGTTSIAAGTLSISSLNNIGTAASPIVLSDGVNKGTLAFATAGTAATAFANGFTVNAGGGKIDNNSASATAFLNVTAGISGTATAGNVAVLTLGGSNSGNASTIAAGESYAQNNISGVIANGTSGGTLAVVKSGSGGWEFTNTNTYSGGTNITAGNIEITVPGALGSGTVNVAAGAQLAFDMVSQTITNSITLNGNTTINGLTGALVGDNLGGGGVNTLTGTLTLAGGVMSNVVSSWNDKSITLAGPVVGSGGLQIDLYKAGNNASVVSLSNTANSFADGVIINGGATLQLNAANVIPYGTGKGDVTVNNGNLNLNGNSQNINGLWGTSNVSAGAGTPTLTVGNNNVSSTFSGVLQNNGGTLAVTKTGTGILTLSGANTATGLFTISGGSLQLGAGGATGSIAANVSDNSALLFNLTGTPTYSGNIGGSGVVFQNGSGLVTLSGTNSYNGGTTINAGNLAFASTAAVPANGTILINAGGALNVAGPYANVAAWLANPNLGTASAGFLALSGTDSSNLNMTAFPSLWLGAVSTGGTYGGTITPGGNTYRIGGGPVTVTSGLTGAGNSLLVSGSNVVVLNGASSFGNGTTLSSGTLVAQNALALGSGSATLNGGTELAIGGGTAGLTLGNTLKLNTGAIISDYGTSLGNFSGPITAAGNFTVGLRDYNATATGRNLTISGPLSGAGNMTISGPASGTQILNLSGNNTNYSGSITIPANTIVRALGSSSVKPLGSSLVTLNNGGTLDLTPTLSAGTSSGFYGSYYSYAPITNGVIGGFDFGPYAVVGNRVEPSLNYNKNNAGSDFSSAGGLPPSFASTNYLGAEFNGVLSVSSTGSGTYTFSLNSDDGSTLWIDGQSIIAGNDNSQGVGAVRTGTVTLAAGPHSINVKYGNGTGGAAVVATITGPDTGNNTNTLGAGATNGNVTNFGSTLISGAPLNYSNPITVANGASSTLYLEGQSVNSTGLLSFSGGNSTLTVQGITGLETLNFSGGVALSGTDKITSGSAIITSYALPGLDITISGALSGTGATFIKGGPQRMLTITGNNASTLTGSTFDIQGGLLTVAASNSLGDATNMVKLNVNQRHARLPRRGHVFPAPGRRPQPGRQHDRRQRRQHADPHGHD